MDLKQDIILGTYTKRESEGIYKITLDTDAKQLENLEVVAEVGSPTYLDLSADHSRLYSILTKESSGGLVSFKKDDVGTFQQAAVSTSEGSAPCYVSYDENRQFLYTANYHSGEVAVYATDTEGSLELKDTVAHSGSSVHENQDAPHAHYLDLTPDEKYLIACDLGTDEVFTYEVSDAGQLSEVSRAKMKPGTGPRHVVFHPNGQFVYVFGELSSEVIAMTYDSETGTLEHVQTIPSIPETHTEFNSGAAIRVSPDGKFLYASNRGHNSLVVYAINETDGTLELVEWTSTEGDFPRDFNLDPSGQFVVVGHQESDNLTLFERNEETGKLELLQKDLYAPEVICVRFVD